MPVNLTVRRLRQEVPEFKASLCSGGVPGQVELLRKICQETRKGRDGERGKRMRKGWQREGETE